VASRTAEAGDEAISPPDFASVTLRQKAALLDRIGIREGVEPNGASGVVILVEKVNSVH
jgi:hypothetical protein